MADPETPSKNAERAEFLSLPETDEEIVDHLEGLIATSEQFKASWLLLVDLLTVQGQLTVDDKVGSNGKGGASTFRRIFLLRQQGNSLVSALDRMLPSWRSDLDALT